jgi:basic membrane protein A
MRHSTLHLLGCVAVLALLGGLSVPALARITHVGLVTDVGKVDDRTFNEFAYQGMMRAVKEFGFKSAFIETQQPTDYEKNIEQFASTGYELIITVGFMLGDATKKMALKYPHVQFAIVDFAYEPPVANIIGLTFAEDQSGFLAGALAGLMTKAKTVGMVAGVAIPPVIRFRKGYEAGVKYVCPACQIVGVYIDNFTDPARGKTAALSQIDEGADVIFGGGGTTGSGAILGASQAGVWVLGVDQDEYLTTFKQGEAKGANKLLSSAMKRVDNAVYGAIKMAVEGTFKGGTQVFDASNDGIGLAPFHATESAVPETVKAKLQEIAAGLKAGMIKTGVTR